MGSQRFIAIALTVVAATTCARKEPLTAQKAQEIISAYQFKKEPVYAEVPQRVWWSPTSPKDDYDERALRTLENLRQAGLVTLEQRQDGVITSVVARVSDKGFRILGTAPSWRGPVYRAQIAEKVYDGLRNFQRHPSEPTTGTAELVWHYTSPTWLYPLFETKINKPLNKPFVSLISFYWKDYQWKFDVTVRKAEAE
ncbi:MAG TPA: hypothetical protein VLV78_20185 [Thermoanaerobaculia bacterium]|nr:hypothetical protein [Thermoanaerobaculia bacterium]